jgi:hypothetical protein
MPFVDAESNWESVSGTFGHANNPSCPLSKISEGTHQVAVQFFKQGWSFAIRLSSLD